MKTIRPLILTVLTVCLTLSAWGQSRTNTSSQLSGDAQSEKLRSAIGWKQDILGNWISNQNAIADAKLDEQALSTVSQNFKWIQFVSFKKGNQKFYAFLFENTEYLSGNKDERRVHFYLMPSASYSNFVSSINKKAGETFTAHSSLYGYMSDREGNFSANHLMQLISQTVEKNIGTFEYDLVVNSQHVDNQDVVRFRLPEKSSIMGSRLSDGYFEVEMDDFKKILLPVSTPVNDEFDLGLSSYTQSNVSNQRIKDDIEDRDASLFTEAIITTSSIDQQSVEQLSQNSDNNMMDIDDGFDRKDKEHAIVSSPIATLSQIKGWYYTTDGNWVDDQSHQYNFETVGRYELRNFTYHKKEYVLITRYEKYAGATYYLIAKDDYVKTLQGLETSALVKFPLVAYADIGNNLEDMVKLSETIIDTPLGDNVIVSKTSYLVLQYKMSQTKNVSRFFIFKQECSRYGSDTYGENCNIIVSNKIRYDDESLLMSDALFGKMYYETTYTDFMSFLRTPIKESAVLKQKDMDFTQR